MDVAERLLSDCPTTVAALLLVARNICERLELPAPDVASIMKATGATRSTAYDQANLLTKLMPTLVKAPGRPEKPAVAPPPDDAKALTHAVLSFLYENPGCARRGEQRCRYTDAFRHFILEQRRKYAALDAATFSAAVHISSDTLKEWTQPPPPLPSPSTPPSTPPSSDVSSVAQMAQIQTVVTAYKLWAGTLVGFAEHVSRDLHIPFTRAFIAHILEAHGARHVQRRGRRTVDELALRGSFKTFFAGAQWTADGMQVPVVVDDQRFVFNLELNVDPHTGAFVGASVRDEEDSAAVVEAFVDGVENTGAPPIAELLDNRPSNHTPEVDEALGETMRIRATPFRPQNKAHVEGAFGLFSQVLPALFVDRRLSAHDVAKALLRIAVEVWARTTNHRPRADRQGKSRVELYGEQPTQEQVDEALRALKEIAARQERARLTLEARRRPEVLAFLDEHFERLGLLDPERHIRIAIAAYPLTAIASGVAIFEGKRLANTLPEDADGRYLFGIIKNVVDKEEGEHVARRMLALRLDAQDRTLKSLVTEREKLCATVDVPDVCKGCVDRALETTSSLDRLFWLDTLAELLEQLPEQERHERFLDAARRIHATFATPPRERQDAVRVLGERLLPLAA